ncbi:MAG: hypothetical protein ABI433_04335 [Burkholderiaceae bacterium]
MNNETCSLYRGCAIVTRSMEVPPLSEWAELPMFPTHWTRRFAASFSVKPHDGRRDSWQQFPMARFNTRRLAAEHALCEAQKSIDMMLAAI